MSLLLDSAERVIGFHEGLRLVPYQDTFGHWTVGRGHNLDAHPLPDVKLDQEITVARAEEIFAADLAAVREQLTAALSWFHTLDPVRAAVLLDMAFNMGVGKWAHSGLLGFSNTLNRVRQGAYPQAAASMLRSLWAKQVGYRSVRLAHMMETGAWPVV